MTTVDIPYRAFQICPLTNIKSDKFHKYIFDFSAENDSGTQIASNPVVSITTGGHLGRKKSLGVNSYESIKKNLGARYFFVRRIVYGGGTVAGRSGRH